jgi:hypothetical protein
MLRYLIEGLRERPPSWRTQSDMAGLLEEVCAGWSLDRRLLSRAGGYTRTCAAEVAGYASVRADESRVLETGGLDLRFRPFDLHRVVAAGRSPAISLHVYSRPLRTFFVYDEFAERCESALGTYDAVLPAYTGLQRR